MQLNEYHLRSRADCEVYESSFGNRKRPLISFRGFQNVVNIQKYQTIFNICLYTCNLTRYHGVKKITMNKKKKKKKKK